MCKAEEQDGDRAMANKDKKTAEQESSGTVVLEKEEYKVLSLAEKLPRNSAKAFGPESGSECTVGYITVPCQC